ncbi:MAG TPA: YjgN family protein [Burkholderiales bacterium]|nr:YjgN family protein [Burkholderiales bacterium]
MNTVVGSSARLLRDADSTTLTTQSAPGRYPVSFTGTAGEYFRIWIVNLCLTILTLGIYSAWAKVRRKRYFYAHTLIDGDNFEYCASPIAILKGRLIAGGAIVLFYGLGYFAPSYQWTVLVAAVFVVPWLLVRSLAFNAYNTAYRNIRLHFHGTYGACLKLIIGYGLLVIVTLGIGYPYLKTRMLEFMCRNHCYGKTQFEVADLKPPLFRAYSYAIGMGILGLIALFAIGAGVAMLSGAGRGVSALPRGFDVFIMILTYAGYLLIFAYLRARVANAVFNNLVLGPVQFECSLRARDMFVLYLANIIAIIVTLGLATPWAVVRTMRYRAEKMVLVASAGLARFVQDESSQVGAAGEEVGEVFGIDIGM